MTHSSSELHRTLTRRATIRAMLLVLVGSVGVQCSAIFAIGLFDDLTVMGTTGMRMLIAALLLSAIFRPRLRGRTKQQWIAILLFGTAMAMMTSFLYLAFSRLPMGIAMTIDFLGPCLVALAGSRRPREGMLAVLAFIGVGLIAGFGGELDALGMIYAGIAAIAYGSYTLFSAKSGQSAGGLGNTTLSVAVAAIWTLPFSVPTMPLIRAEHLLPLVASALLGTALAFTCDTMAGRLTSARVLGVLFAFDPAVATVFGAVFLGQMLTLPALGGVVLVIVAGALIVWFAGERSSGSGSEASIPADTGVSEVVG